MNPLPPPSSSPSIATAASNDVPGSVLCIRYLTEFSKLGGQYYCYSHFTDEKIERLSILPKFTYLVWSRLRVLADTLLLYLVSFLSKIDYKLNIKQCPGDTLKKSFIINETQRKIFPVWSFHSDTLILGKTKIKPRHYKPSNAILSYISVPFVY